MKNRPRVRRARVVLFSAAVIVYHAMFARVDVSPSLFTTSSGGVGYRYPPDVCRFNLSVYVYDDLPAEFTSEIEQHWTNTTTREILAKSSGQWDDSNTEYQIAQLFRSTPCRTGDPAKANLFVVPYPHQSDCMTSAHFHGGYGPGCPQVPTSKMRRLFGWLNEQPSYNSDNQHVFLTMYHRLMLRPEVQDLPLRIVSTPQYPNPYQPGHIVVPLLNEALTHRPSYIVNFSNSWWTRPRKYSLAFVYGRLNRNMKVRQPRVFRRYFHNSLLNREKDLKSQGGNSTIGGLPYFVSFGTFNKTESGLLDVTSVYEDSIFCPILPGDLPHARRIFDAMAHGCLPVFMSWPAAGTEGDWENSPSWYTPSSVQAKYNYPFFADLYTRDPFYVEEENTIDYESFSVVTHGNSSDAKNFLPMIEKMDTLIRLAPDEIRRRQLALKENVIPLIYGLGEDAHRYDDAFSRTMRILEAYVHRVVTGRVV